MEEIVLQITMFNRAWKQAREQWGPNSPLTNMLRHRKSDLQARLIRENRGIVYLAEDSEAEEGEPLYSVRLARPVTLPGGLVRTDADHMPVRIAQELFTDTDIAALLSGARMSMKTQ